jgi:ABC-type transport system substrate-binding protein
MRAWRRLSDLVGLAILGVLIAFAGPVQAQNTPKKSAPPPSLPTRADASHSRQSRLVIATGTFYDTLDPHLQLETTRSLMQLNFYDALYRWQNGPVRVSPWLAQSYTLSEDGKVFRFSLRKGARFHDGAEVTANDVVYSIERILALKRGAAPLLAGLVNPGSTKAVDAHTVEFSLSRPSPLFLTLLPAVQIVNSALLKSNEVNNDWGRAWLQQNEAGSGAFRLKEFIAGTGLTAERVADYWNGGWGRKPPEIVEVRTSIDTDAALDSLIKGDVQIVDAQLLPYQKKLVRAAREVNLVEDESPRIFVGLIHAGREPMKALAVRQILTQAFDYDAFVHSTLGPGSRRVAMPLPPRFISAGRNAEVGSQSFDLEAARGGLAKLKAPLREITIGAILGDVDSERAAGIMAQGLIRIGVPTRIVTEPWPVVSSRMHNERQMYDMLFLWQGARYLDANNWIGEMYDCDLVGSGNSSWYCNKDVDRLLKEARTATDSKVSARKFEEAAAKVAQDAGGLFIATGPASAAYQRRIRGLRFTPTGETFELRSLSLE